MAVVSGLAGPVLAEPVFDTSDSVTVHVRTINNKVKNDRSLLHCSPVEKPGLSEVQNIDYPKTSPRSLCKATVDWEMFRMKYFAAIVRFHRCDQAKTFG